MLDYIIYFRLSTFELHIIAFSNWFSFSVDEAVMCQVRKRQSIIEKQDTYMDESMTYMQNSPLEVGIAEGIKVSFFFFNCLRKKKDDLAVCVIKKYSNTLVSSPTDCHSSIILNMFSLNVYFVKGDTSFIIIMLERELCLEKKLDDINFVLDHLQSVFNS